MARNANKHRREFTFEVGDLAWLTASHLRLPRALTARRKLQPFYGPFKIARVLSDVAYELELPAHYKIHPVVHISHLKANADGSLDFPLRPAYTAPPPPEIVTNDEGDDEEHFHVESFRNHRFRPKPPRKPVKGKKRQVSFLVKWTGAGEGENVWLTENSLRADMDEETMEKLIVAYVAATGAKLHID